MTNVTTGSVNGALYFIRGKQGEPELISNKNMTGITVSYNTYGGAYAECDNNVSGRAIFIGLGELYDY